MKRSITLLSLLLSFTCLFSQEQISSSNTDTTIVVNNRQIKVSENDGKINIEVYSISGDTLSRIYETIYTDSTKTTRWEIGESINFPFSDYIGKKKKKSNDFSPHWAGVGFGFVNAMDSHFKFLNSQAPNGVSLDFGESFEIFWNVFDIAVPLYKDRFGMVFGFGLDWRNYKMNEDKRFIYSDHRIGIETMPEGSTLSYSRLKTVDIVLPVLFEYQIKPGCNAIYIQGGAHVNFRTHSSLKTRFTSDDLAQKYFKDGIGSNPVNIDLVLKAGFRNIGFYVKYSPNKMFESHKGPDMRSFSTGVALTL